MSELNVEKIMEEIREEIKAKGYTEDMLSFSEIILDDMEINVEEFDHIKFREELSMLNTIWNINPNRDIEHKSGIKGKFASIFKKIIRKCIRFYISPIVLDQDAFNATTVRLINMFNLFVNENIKLMEEMERLREEQETVIERLDQIERASYKGE